MLDASRMCLSRVSHVTTVMDASLMLDATRMCFTLDALNTTSQAAGYRPATCVMKDTELGKLENSRSPHKSKPPDTAPPRPARPTCRSSDPAISALLPASIAEACATPHAHPCFSERRLERQTLTREACVGGP